MPLLNERRSAVNRTYIFTPMSCLTLVILNKRIRFINGKRVYVVTYLYTSKMEEHIYGYFAGLERYFLAVNISYRYTYVLEGEFFDWNIIYMFKSMIAIL
jgi:hypothetical protein